MVVAWFLYACNQVRILYLYHRFVVKSLLSNFSYEFMLYWSSKGIHSVDTEWNYQYL